jgi:2-haloacid dehalogenase
MWQSDRRRFVNLAAASAAASFVTGAAIGAPDVTPRVKAIAFDAFVIFDSRPITALT